MTFSVNTWTAIKRLFYRESSHKFHRLLFYMRLVSEMRIWQLQNFSSQRGDFCKNRSPFLAATKQLVEHFCLSVRLSVCPSVCYTFFTMFPSSYHHEIFRIIAKDKSDVHAKGQGQRPKVKVTEVKTQLSCLRTVTPVWIHIWWRNDAQNLMLLMRGALLFFKVIRQISSSQG